MQYRCYAQRSGLTDSPVMSTLGAQLPLGIRLKSNPSFANFVPGPNAEALHLLKAKVAGQGDRVTYLWGGEGTGKTHLLAACCLAQAKHTGGNVCLPLTSAAELAPRMLDGLERLALVCIDDVDAVAGEPTWEDALFQLYERVQGTGTRMLLAARRPPILAGFRLPDLASRFALGMVLRLHAIDDEARCHALQLRAQERGFAIPDEVARFLLRHSPRDMHSLFELFERIDRLTLAEKRLVTIPLIKGLLGTA